MSTQQTATELLCQLNKPWNKLHNVEKLDVLGAWLWCEEDILDYLCDFPYYKNLAKVISAEMPKSDFIDDIYNYLLRVKESDFEELADKCLAINAVAYRERLKESKDEYRYELTIRKAA